MVAPRTAADIDVFPQLDVTVRAQDRQASIAPGAEAFRGKPVDANEAGSAVATQHDFAEIFELGGFRVAEVANVGRDNFSLGRSREMEELVALMRGDVTQDSPIALALEKPVGARVVA